MMDVLGAVERVALTSPKRIAHRWRGVVLDFGSLWAESGSLASHLDRLPAGRPVVVLGHKHPRVLVCFLACVRSGHPYVPVDRSVPAGRLADILDAARPAAVLLPESGADELAGSGDAAVWDCGAVEAAIRENGAPADHWVGAEEPFYIIFTSGSTGTPKGVEVPRLALDNFVTWGLGLRHADGVCAGPDDQAVYLNQAPFSFDLSVFDLWLSLASGGTLFSIDKDAIAQPADLAGQLAVSGVTTWVSTPSFADLCLADPGFTKERLPALELFLFCGETLDNGTARQLLDRFPGSSVVNTYGPTESTVAVTSVNCTPEVLDAHPVLPVGAPRPGTRILIRDPSGRELPERESGEIVIAGDTVALGYHARPDLTAAAFETIDGQRAYRTGDRGRMDSGQLYFEGRLDFQVKLHGYRIELEDIEEHLRRLPDVQRAVVLPQYRDGGNVDHLVAVVQRSGGLPASSLRQAMSDKAALKESLPQYMVPKVFRYVDSIPLTPNGKLDRGAARALLA